MFRRTNLLHEHNKESALCRTTVAPDSEELFPQRLALTLAGLDIEELGGIVHVTGGLDLVGSESAGGLEGFCPTSLLHVPGCLVSVWSQTCVLLGSGLPSRTLWAKIDLNHNDERRNRRRSHHPAPLCVFSEDRRSLEDDRRHKSEHDTKGGPPDLLVERSEG